MSSEQQQQQQEPASKEVLDRNSHWHLTNPGRRQTGMSHHRCALRHATMRLSGCLALCMLMVAGAGNAFAAAGNVTVTKATGGSAISADTTGGAYTALSG